MKTNISCDFAPNTRTIREFVTKTIIIHEFAFYTSKIRKINCDCNAIHVLVSRQTLKLISVCWNLNGVSFRKGLRLTKMSCLY